MKKSTLLLTLFITIGLATTGFARRGGGGGGRGRGGGGRGMVGRGGGFRGGRGFRGGGFRGRRGFVGHRGFGRRGRGGWRRRGWGWRRPWRRRGWGWRRRGWYGPGWGYGPYWGAGIAVGAAAATQAVTHCIDNAGYRSWEITNNTGDVINVQSRSGPRITINPGDTQSLNHPTCIFRVNTPYGNGTFQTRDHFINIQVDPNGQLIAETS